MRITEGNRKLLSNEVEKFLIWDLPAEKTCPESTELCRKFCYAKKAERMYKNTRIMRENNLEASKKSDFVELMTAQIKEIIGKKSYNGKKVYFRLHSSGDFYNSTYFLHWCRIMRNFPEISFTAYTKSLQIVSENYNIIPDNFKILYSTFNDTKVENMIKAKSLNLPFFTAVDKSTFEEIKGENVTCVGNCQYCKHCYNKSNNDVYCKIH